MWRSEAGQSLINAVHGQAAWTWGRCHLQMELRKLLQEVGAGRAAAISAFALPTGSLAACQGLLGSLQGQLQLPLLLLQNKLGRKESRLPAYPICI